MDTTLPQPTPPVKKPDMPPSISPGSSKEISGSISASFAEHLRPVEATKDIQLPKEILSAGVKPKQTVISIPPRLVQSGVKPAGPNVTLGTGSTITLPLTDRQIADGLHKGINDSIRWLAEWCRRKLLQLTMAPIKH